VEQCSQLRIVDRKISNYVLEDEVAPTNPKVETVKGRHQPKKPKAINKARGKEDGNQKHPR
jgi:hypothetical protein